MIPSRASLSFVFNLPRRASHIILYMQPTMLIGMECLRARTSRLEFGDEGNIRSVAATGEQPETSNSLTMAYTSVLIMSQGFLDKHEIEPVRARCFRQVTRNSQFPREKSQQSVVRHALRLGFES